MSQWSDKFDSHQVHQLLTTAQTLFDHAAEHIEDDTQALEALERLRSIHGHLVRVLENINPEIVPLQGLGNMIPHLGNMNNEIQAFVSNQDTGHLVKANSHADNFLPHVGAIPTLVTPADVDGMRDAITSFRRSAGQLIHHLEQEADDHREVMDKDRETSSENIDAAKDRVAEVEAELEKLEGAIQTQKARLDTAIAEFQSQFSKHQDVRQEQFTEAEKERADANKEAIDEQEEQFTATSEAHKEKFAGICDDAKKNFSSFQTETKATVDGFIKELEEYKAQAEKLVHVIGNTGMVGGYQKTANSARNTARFWQGVAIVSFIGLIWFAIKVFMATQGPDFSWSIFAGRAFVAGTFGIVAAFAARQSDRHEEAEWYTRRVELELASIDPYLVALPEKTQHQVKEELAKRLFGQKPLPKKQPKVSGTNADLMNLVRDMVSELIKKQG
ncbi:MAG: hypothetical protein KOO63_00245 [Bacteroidales bacterium]|nr:hypothetical protein [Candidatus Latescibacterota bacterium]